ncbi:hypothetical protein C900_03656 [Fulvivirga imtechensis AK7]|uniref:Uncharacterized protein n=1 Tax=Fulvivirga imtechensis AK7 TaxID=1237149 RepID=L8JT10_9BACT|nr:hypothetical protein C900_03656 [Fulvivirga imtechensis AK7]
MKKDTFIALTKFQMQCLKGGNEELARTGETGQKKTSFTPKLGN